MFVPTTVGVLCYVSGLQSATITKLSTAEVRATHLMGFVADIRIELGKLFYRNLGEAHGCGGKVRADRGRRRLLPSLLGMFLVGGLTGALGFKHAGFLSHHSFSAPRR